MKIYLITILKFTLFILVIYLVALVLYVFLRYIIRKNIFKFQANLAHKIFSEYLKRDFQTLVNEKISMFIIQYQPKQKDSQVGY